MSRLDDAPHRSLLAAPREGARPVVEGRGARGDCSSGADRVEGGGGGDARTGAWPGRGEVEEPVARALAVQRVQLAFLGRYLDGQHLLGAARGLLAAASTPAPASAPTGLQGWRHPYHWAPFVLYRAGR